jgi:arylsulfatase A-like enzyme
MITNDGYAEYHAGGGMHVTLSPTDLHNLAIAVGPDFRRGLSSVLPSGNVDIAPTLLWLMGIKPSHQLDGRILSEALTGDVPHSPTPKASRRTARNEFPDGRWEQYLEFTEVGGVRYLDEGNGRWIPKAAAK